MNRQIRLAAAVAASAFIASAMPAAAASWTFVSNPNPTLAVGATCPGGFSCHRFGIQRGWVAPSNADYKITIAGAEGGAGFYDAETPPIAGGLGAVMSGIYRMSAGTSLVIVAGQAGRSGLSHRRVIGGGGGGGSFVFSVPELRDAGPDDFSYDTFDLGTSTLLAAAGGGGGGTGSYRGGPGGGPGLAGRDGGSVAINAVYTVMGGVDGGPASGVSAFGVQTGFTCSNSGASYILPPNADCYLHTFLSNPLGMEGWFYGGQQSFGTSGGYGGGGIGTTIPLRVAQYWYSDHASGGGGGGYSGGAGGTSQEFLTDLSGAGGGSYISDDAIFVSGLSGANRGNGYVTIELLAGVPEPRSWAMMIAGFGLVGAAARRRRIVTAS